MRRRGLLMGAAGMALLAMGVSGAVAQEVRQTRAEREKAAFAVLMKEAGGGDVKAMYEVGMAYQRAKGVRFDEELAKKWFEKAAFKGSGMGAYRLGDLLRKPAYGSVDRPGPEIDETVRYPAEVYKPALVWYERAAEMGSTRAMLAIGQYYERGEGMEKNEETSRKWYVNGVAAARKAAEAGEAEGMFALGWAYRDGKGVGQSYEDAVKWFRKGADAGDVDSMFALGFRYFRGEGVEQDFEEAMRWFKKAAEHRHAAAMNMIGGMYLHGEGVKSYPRMAKAWYEEAAARGDATAMSNLGYMLFNGRNARQDVKKGLVLLEKAASLGMPFAMWGLGEIYEKGENGVVKDEGKAREWYEKAAAAGYKEAMKWVEENGKDVEEAK